MVNKVILVGGFHEMIELCEDCGYSIVGIIDNTISTNYWNYPIIGTDGDCQELYKKYADIPLVITPVAKSLISQSCITLHNVFSFTKSPINALDDTFTPDCITEPIPIVADLDILAEGLITVSK